MQLHISTGDGVPIYLQIANQVKYLVASGRLEAGNEIPPIRVLARQLLVNPNTVARAYQELIRDGILESRSGRGVFISKRRQVFADAERARRLQHAAEQLCHEAILLDFSIREVRATLDATWPELHREAGRKDPPSKGAEK